jgi:hypothetical protein
MLGHHEEDKYLLVTDAESSQCPLALPVIVSFKILNGFQISK